MWKLTAFGSTDLTVIFNRKENLGTASVMPTLFRTTSGNYDPRGSRNSLQGPQNVPLEGLIYSSNLLTTIQALGGRIGVRDKLYRLLSNGSTQWVYARLLDFNVPAEWPLGASVPVSMMWETAGPWSGTAHNYAADITSNPETVILSNAGNVRQNNIVLSFTPITVGQTMTDLTVQNAVMGAGFRFSGSVGYNDVLIINSETMSVQIYHTSTVTYEDAYDDFVLLSSHVIDRLLAIDPGNNSIAISWTGAGYINANLAFYDSYA